MISTAGRLPTGTVTFLRTDVAGSMQLVRALGTDWDRLNEVHIGLIAAAVELHAGVVVRTEGDAVFAAFPEAGAAIAAAVDAQRALAAHPWPSDAPVRVRMGLHTGEAHLAGADYGGIDVNRAARIAAVGHGGQVVVSATTVSLVDDRLPAGVSLRGLGTYVLRDVPRPERIAQLDIDGLATTFPPLRAAPPDPGYLPARLTSFVGRHHEVDAVAGLVADTRLVTLTGPGGIGKSSLAVEVARRLAPTFRDGAWFVPLAAISDAGAIEAAVASAIGLFDGPERSAASALTGYLAGRSMLLVLDNVEHVRVGAGVVTSLLHASPESRVLATSRASLRLSGEQEYPVPPLDSGRALFIERARAVRPGWDPREDGAILDEICALVDCLPLGIELAAARTSLLPVTAIRDRLAAHLPLPGSGPRDVPARQRTLESTVAWSHELLRPELQTVLHDTAVFDGGFDLAEAEVVIAPDRTGDGEVLDDLLELAEQSLIARDLPDGDAIRFRLLRTIGDVVLSRLAASGREHAVRRRHAQAYLALAREAERHQATTQQAAWMHRLGHDDANLWSAVRWSIDAGEAEIALALVASLWRYWQAAGHLVRGRSLVAEALAMPGAEAAPSSRVRAVAAAGNIAYWRADAHEARRWYLLQSELARAIDDEAAVADATFNLAHVEFLDDADEARIRAVAEDAERRFRDLGDERGTARARWSVPILAVQSGRMEEARAGLDASRSEFERLGDTQYHAMTTASLGWVAFVSGDFPAAVRWSVEAIQETYRLGDLGTTTISLHIGVLMSALIGRAEEAARLTGAFDALSERYGVRPPVALGRFIDSVDPFAMARDALSPEAFDAAYDAGRRMTLDEAVAMVVEIGDTVAAGGQ